MKSILESIFKNIHGQTIIIYYRNRKQLNELILVKGDEYYVFYYDDANRYKIYEALRCLAENSELPDFSWYEVRLLTQTIRREAERAEFGMRLRQK